MAKKKRTKQQTAGGAPVQEGPALSPEEQAARREQQKREWAERKRREERTQSTGNPVLWIGAGVAALAAVLVVGVILLSSGGGGNGSASNATPANTPDARVAGLTVQKTLEIEATDTGQEQNVRYNLTTLVGVAGQLIQIDVKNTGQVHHNLQIAGVDGQYDTLDDWYTDPFAVESGQTGKVLVKIDKPGTYQFHCSFHPNQQVGDLVLS